MENKVIDYTFSPHEDNGCICVEFENGDGKLIDQIDFKKWLYKENYIQPIVSAGYFEDETDDTDEDPFLLFMWNNQIPSTIAIITQFLKEKTI